MINRRNLVGASAVGITILGSRVANAAAQDTIFELPFENASFIRTVSDSTPEATPDASPVADDEPIVMTGYVIGDSATARTLSVFADYRCPHCRMFHVDIEPKLLSEYVATGKLNLELIDFPVVGLTSYDDISDDSMESVQAAEAAAAAAEQGLFLEYREWLYSGPVMLEAGDFADANLIAAAAELGADEMQFSEALKSGSYEPAVAESFLLAMQLGVPGTPSMTLDRGEPFGVSDGAYDDLKAILDEYLEG